MMPAVTVEIIKHEWNGSYLDERGKELLRILAGIDVQEKVLSWRGQSRTKSYEEDLEAGWNC